MEKTKKRFVYPLLVISLCVNAFLLYNLVGGKVKDKPVSKVENEIILTQNELNNILNDNYKVTVVNQQVSNYLIELEAKNRNIQVPDDEDLKNLAESFPSFVGFSTSNEEHSRILTEAYYVYQIYKEDGIDTVKIQEYLINRYNNADVNLYELFIYETIDHNHAVEVENMLKDGKGIADIEKELNIKFLLNYTASMDNVVKEMEEGATSNHNNTDGTLTTEHNSATTTYSVGDIYHVMNSDGMQVILINDILSLNSDPEHFEDLYFAQNYTVVKNNIINDLKSKYVVSYY